MMPTNHATNHPSETALRMFVDRLQGPVVQHCDDEYNQARRVWNVAVDRRPALVVRPRGIDDIVLAVDFARQHDLPLAVRGGGHSPAGYGTVDDGVVIDLSSLKRLDIDPATRAATAEPGLTWGEYNAHTHRHGLATPGGDVAAVGIAGLTLGGGLGWLMRKHGLTIDNLLAVDVVTADGRRLTASETEHPELFWALRGGGGNFGIATRFQYRLHSVDAVLGGAIVYPATRNGLRAYADASSTAPPELTTIGFVTKAPPLPFIPADAYGTPVHVIVPCYSGDLDTGQRVLAPLRSLGGRPLVDTTGPRPYPALYEFTAMGAVSRPHAIRNGFLHELSDDTIEIILDAVHRLTSPYGVIALRELGGAIAAVPNDATAFAHRDKAFYLAADNGWEPDDPQPQRHIDWTEGVWHALAPHTDGAYASYLGDEGVERVRASYPTPTYARLAEIKRRYDPDNVFRLNANVPPSPTTDTP